MSNLASVTNAAATTMTNETPANDGDGIVDQFAGTTILLVQFSANEETRTYLDCCAPAQAIECLIRIYEHFITNRTTDPQQRQEYLCEDLLKFIDQLFDLSALTYNLKANGFTAHGKPWFKGQVHSYLRKQAADGPPDGISKS